MEIDPNKLPEQFVISRDLAVNTVILMQNLKVLVPQLMAAGVFPQELLLQLPATARLIREWDQLADTTLATLARQEATELFKQVGIDLTKGGPS